MPKTCCVSEPHSILKPSFSVPKDELKKLLWEASLGMKLKKSYRVCATHFNQSDIVSTWSSGEGVNKYTVSIYFIIFYLY